MDDERNLEKNITFCVSIDKFTLQHHPAVTRDALWLLAQSIKDYIIFCFVFCQKKILIEKNTFDISTFYIRRFPIPIFS